MGVIKYNVDQVRGVAFKLGLELVDKEYKLAKSKITLVDKEKYYYYTIFMRLLSNILPDRFSKSNPYTI